MNSTELTLTANQVRVLKLILGVDMGALGLDQRDQNTAATILLKLRKASHET